MEEMTELTDVNNTHLEVSTEEIPENSSGNEKNVFQYPTLFASKTLLELSNCSWSRATRYNEDVQPYLRGCKWSPDGTCCLSVVNNDGIHITELPRDLYAESPNTNRNIDILDSVVHVKESGLVYDFCWFPGMNSQLPESCCWLTTKKNSPVQMWDAFDGSLRSSYRGYNAVDEMEPALSVTFTPDGSRIVAGYKKVLRTFDVDRPGRDCTEHKIQSPAACLATDSNLLAVGSWSTTINLYNVSQAGTYKSIGKMHGHAGGVTHVKFTPDGLKLVSGARKDHRLLIWDIRYYRRPLNILTRTVDTNQRIYFDISPCGKYLVTGGTDGVVKVWDVDQADWKSGLDVERDIGIDNATYKFPLHKDCCNSVSIHPFRPILATGSGQYHFVDPTTPVDDEKLPEHSLEQNHSHDLQNLLQQNQSQSVYNFSELNQLQNGQNFLEVNQLQNGQNSLDVSMSSVSEIQCDVKDKSAVEMKYSSQTENCVVFWWTGEILD